MKKKPTNKVLNLVTTFKAKEDDDGSIVIRGMASTSDIDRAGDVVLPEAWAQGGLKNFEKNPIILFNHNYNSPVGKATEFKIVDKGLEIAARISKAAASNVYDLIKDGVLGTFSVGFRIKDADYIEETGGLRIKDAELYEVSIVSIPCNQAATFSLAKSFDSEKEYEEFKKTFKTNSADLASQSLANEGGNPPNVDGEALEGADAQSEIEMTKEELEAFAKKVAEETAAKTAMKQAEARAAEEAERKAQVEKDAAEKAAKEEQDKDIQSLITTGIESGAEKLIKDFQAELAEKDANMAEVIEKYKKELEEKSDEITKMRESKRVFGDRGTDNSSTISKWGQDFLAAHMLGVMTGKGWNTEFAKQIQEKAGIDYSSSAPDIDQEVSRLIEKEVTLNLRTAGVFREIKVNGAATVLPIQPDVNGAVWQTGAATAGNLENRGASDNTFQPGQVILNAYRLISQTYMDNHVDEEVLVNLMPMLIDSVARAHAKAVDSVIINGNGTISGLDNYAEIGSTLSIGGNAALTAADLMGARKGMGKYGVSPQDVVYVVSMGRYYELIEDADFSDISDVGSDVATKITGMIGSVYGSPVIVSDNFPDEAADAPVAFAVATRNYAIPRLRGVSVEQDYEVGNQRRVIVATQSLGFEELVPDYANNRSAVKIDLVA